MPVKESSLTLSKFIERLASSGLRAGDTVFVQLSWPAAEQETWVDDANDRILSALLEIIGPNGTLLVPAFTFSFYGHEAFDRASSPAVAGSSTDAVGFSELVRNHAGAVRSDDPLYSVVGIGAAAEELLSNLPNSSVGPNSLMDRLTRRSAKLCLAGVGLERAVLFDFAEDACSAPWRFKKLFTGKAWRNGVHQRQGWIASVVNTELAEKASEIRKRVAARCEAALNLKQDDVYPVVVADARDLLAMLGVELGHEVKAFGPVPKHGGVSVELPPSASMSETISALWRLPRDIVSDGYDTALHALAGQVRMQIHEYPTGTECWSWLIPEKWTCRDARLETLDGHVLFSYRDNPLHAVSYSLPFDGVVSRDELFGHLHTHPRLDDAIPFIFKYYERDWG